MRKSYKRRDKQNETKSKMRKQDKTEKEKKGNKREVFSAPLFSRSIRSFLTF